MSFSKSGGLPRKKKKTLLSGKKAAKGQLIQNVLFNVDVWLYIARYPDRYTEIVHIL